MGRADGGNEFSNTPYGSDKIGTHACGPTAMSIVVSSLAGETVDPPHMAQWSVDNGGYCPGNGSYHKLIPDAAKAWGLSCEGDLSAQGIVDALSNGKLVVVIMGKGHFTSSGHFIVLRGQQCVCQENGRQLCSQTIHHLRYA